MSPDSSQPIIACSSGHSRAAISVIRISGFDYFDELNPFLSLDLNTIESQKTYFCRLLDNGEVIDEIILVWFKAPKSYNGENIIELSVHGNPLNVTRIIELITNNTHIRKAEPGEFSLRALNNKKMTLNEVEGLYLLLNANSVFALKQGYSLLSGNLKESFEELYHKFLNHKSAIEMGFDFLDDIGEEQFNINLKETFIQLEDSINKLYKRSLNANFNLLKPEVSIAGLPNAGKSSLFNTLLNDNRSIVSDIAGTTRDYVSEEIYIKNNIYKIIDTAGIRESNDQIEIQGIKKAVDIIESSFFKILVINPFEFNAAFFSRIAQLTFDLVIFSHSDVEGFESEVLTFIQNWNGPIEPLFYHGPIEATSLIGSIEPGGGNGPIGPFLRANFENLGKNSELINFIGECINSKFLKLLDFDPIIINRHSESIKNIYSAFQDYSKIYNSNQSDLAIMSSELYSTGHCISELIGIISPDDVLHNIFNNFCIGK